MWYVVQVMTGRETELASRLKEQGISAFVPRENRRIRSGGSWIQKEYILFSGYVFLDMAYNAENYYKVKNLPGVIRFLGDSRNPSRLSYLEAEWIRILTGRDGAPIEPTLVRIGEDGSLKALDGVLVRLENRVVKVDRRNRKATFEITICNERKEVQLSIRLEEDLNTKDADVAAPEDAAAQVLEEAT